MRTRPRWQFSWSRSVQRLRNEGSSIFNLNLTYPYGETLICCVRDNIASATFNSPRRQFPIGLNDYEATANSRA